MTILNDTQNIRTIYHIGDVHVWKDGNRDEEYTIVFENMYNEMKKKDNKKSLIVITGDIFNDGLSPTSVNMVKKIFINLCEICDVIVFRGNHDQKTKYDKEALDYLYPVLHNTITKNKLHILEKTGEYIYSNIIFGYTDVYDNEVYKIIANNDNNNDTNNKIKIGLWHGTMYGSKTDSNIVFKDEHNVKFKCDDFSDYDYVMLGDIHKYQYMNKAKTIAYCGSTIQQNHGESLKDHGYIEWDIITGKSKFIRIKNEYGHITIDAKDNTIVPYDKTEFPPNIYLRVKYNNCTDAFISNIRTDIEKTHKIVRYQSEMIYDKYTYHKTTTQEEENETIQEINNDKTVVEELMKVIKNDDDIDIDDMKQMKTILESTTTKIEHDYMKKKIEIRLKKLMFDNFNVFGTNNCIDYESLSGIINICGPNGQGKSSAAIYVLLYALYGICENKIQACEYVNKKTTLMRTDITLSINNIEYRILREYDTKTKNKSTVTLFKIENDIETNITDKHKLTTEKDIINLIGDSSELIQLSIMEQKKSTSFLDLKDNEKCDFLCKSLGLDVYEKIGIQLKKDNNDLQSTIKYNKSIIYNDPKLLKGDNETIKNEELANINTLIENIKKKETTTNTEYQMINKKRIEIDLIISNLEKDKTITSTKNTDNQIETLKESIKVLENKINKCNANIANNKIIISEYGDMEKKNEIFEKNKSTEIDNTNTEINQLSKNYIKQPEKLHDISEIQNKQKSLEKKLLEMTQKSELLKKTTLKLKSDIKNYEEDSDIEEGYEKYTTMQDKIHTINEKKNFIKNEITTIQKKINDKKEEYCTIKKKANKIKIEQDTINEELKLYENIDSEMETYNTQKQNHINKLQTEIEEKYLIRENIPQINIPQTNISQTNKTNEINKLKTELLKTETIIKSEENNILQLQKQIKDVPQTKNQEENYERLLELRKERETLNSKMQDLTNKHNLYTNHSEMLKNHKFNSKCTVCMSNDITKDKIETEKNIATTQTEINQLNTNIKENEKEHKKYAKYEIYEQIKNENNTINNQIYNITINKNALHLKLESDTIKMNKLKDEIQKNEELNTKIRTNEKIDEFIANNKKTIKTLQNEKFDKYEKYTELKDKKSKNDIKLLSTTANMVEYEKYEDELLIYNEKIELLEKDTTTINKKYKNYVKYGTMFTENEKNKKQLEMETNEYEKIIKDIEIYNGRILAINKEIDEYEIHLKIAENNKKIDTEIKNLKQIIQEKKKLINDDYILYKNLITETNDNITQVTKMTKELKENQNEYDTKKELIEKKKQHTKLCCDRDEISKEYTNTLNEKNNIEKEKILLEEKVRDLKFDIKKIQTLRNEYMDANKKLKIYEKILEAINTGMYDNILSTRVLPNFCKCVNEILSQYVNFKIKMTYDNREILVEKNDNGVYSHAQKMSGYESLMCNIAFRLALSSNNRTYKTNFYIIDEGFAFCDDVSVLKLNNLFMYMKERYDFVIIVSHNEQIKMYTGTNILIEKKNNFSYVNMIADKNKTKKPQIVNQKNNNTSDSSDSSDSSDDDTTNNRTTKVPPKKAIKQTKKIIIKEKKHTK